MKNISNFIKESTQNANLKVTKCMDDVTGLTGKMYGDWIDINDPDVKSILLQRINDVLNQFPQLKLSDLRDYSDDDFDDEYKRKHGRAFSNTTPEDLVEWFFDLVEGSQYVSKCCVMSCDDDCHGEQTIMIGDDDGVHEV